MIGELNSLSPILAVIELSDMRLPFWYASLAIILFLFWIIGGGVKKSYIGILIDSRGKVSLSRFQICLWTWLILATVLAIACSGGSMNIVLEPPLWALLGISVGSAAGSVIVTGVKRTKLTDLSEKKVGKKVRDLAKKEGEYAEGGNREGEWLEGLVHCTRTPRFSQVFQGEEAGDHDYIDISKVQMFILTVVLAVGYTVVLWQYLHGDLVTLPTNLGEKYTLPTMSKEAVTILGISHGGYLTIKSAPKTPVAADSAQ